MEHTAPVKSVCWAPDGHSIASGSAGGTVRLWDVATAKCRFSLPAETRVFSVAISSESQFVFGGCRDGKLKAWNVKSCSLTACQTAHLEAGGVHSVTIAQHEPSRPDFSCLLTAGFETIVRWVFSSAGQLTPTNSWSGHKVCLSHLLAPSYARGSNTLLTVLDTRRELPASLLSREPNGFSLNLTTTAWASGISMRTGHWQCCILFLAATPTTMVREVLLLFPNQGARRYLRQLLRTGLSVSGQFQGKIMFRIDNETQTDIVGGP